MRYNCLQKQPPERGSLFLKYEPKIIKEVEKILNDKLFYCSKCERILPSYFMKNTNYGLCYSCYEEYLKENNPKALVAFWKKLTRKCNRCSEIKSLTDKYFNKCKSGECGLSRVCKKCYCFSHNKRKYKKSGLNGTFTIKDWDECKAFFNNRCAYCGKEEKLTQDHIVPFVEQGRYERNNIVPVCKSCNSRKSKKDMKHWYIKQEFFSNERLQRIEKWIYQ